jgi:hypothetical protein
MPLIGSQPEWHSNPKVCFFLTCRSSFTASLFAPTQQPNETTNKLGARDEIVQPLRLGMGEYLQAKGSVEVWKQGKVHHCA